MKFNGQWFSEFRCCFLSFFSCISWFIFHGNLSTAFRPGNKLPGYFRSSLRDFVVADIAVIQKQTELKLGEVAEWQKKRHHRRPEFRVVKAFCRFMSIQWPQHAPLPRSALFVWKVFPKWTHRLWERTAPELPTTSPAFRHMPQPATVRC